MSNIINGSCVLTRQISWSTVLYLISIHNYLPTSVLHKLKRLVTLGMHDATALHTPYSVVMNTQARSMETHALSVYFTSHCSCAKLKKHAPLYMHMLVRLLANTIHSNICERQGYFRISLKRGQTHRGKFQEGANPNPKGGATPH